MITKEKIIDQIIERQELGYLTALWNDNHSKKTSVLDLIEDLREIATDAFLNIQLTRTDYSYVCGKYFEVKIWIINDDEISDIPTGIETNVRFKGLDTQQFYEVQL